MKTAILLLMTAGLAWTQTKIHLSTQADELTVDIIASAAKRGNGARVQLAGADTPAANDCAKFDASGNLVSAGAACGSGGGGGSYTAGTGVDAAQLAGGTIAVDPRGNAAKVQMAGADDPATNDCAKFDANNNLVSAGAPCGSGGGSFSAGTGIASAPLASNIIAVDTATVPTFLTAFASLNFGSLAQHNCEEQTIALPGAATTESVAPGWPFSLEAGLIGQMFVSNAGVITVRLCKITSGTVDPVDQNFRATIVRGF